MSQKRLSSMEPTVFVFPLHNRLKGGEMAWCRPWRTGVGLCPREKWRVCPGRAHEPFTSRRTRRALASPCATSSSTHQSRLSTASRLARCSQPFDTRRACVAPATLFGSIRSRHPDGFSLKSVILEIRQ